MLLCYWYVTFLHVTNDGGHFELCQVQLGLHGFYGCQLHGAVLDKLIVYQLAQKTMVFEKHKSAPFQNTGASWWLPWTQLYYNCHQHTLLWVKINFFSSSLWRWGPMQAMASSFLRFLDHTQWRVTFGSTPLDEWSACHRYLYLTIHNIHNRQIPHCSRQDSNPQSQQASGCSPTP